MNSRPWARVDLKLAVQADTRFEEARQRPRAMVGLSKRSLTVNHSLFELGGSLASLCVTVLHIVDRILSDSPVTAWGRTDLRRCARP
jgi:hypothetical protein